MSPIVVVVVLYRKGSPVSQSPSQGEPSGCYFYSEWWAAFDLSSAGWLQSRSRPAQNSSEIRAFGKCSVRAGPVIAKAGRAEGLRDGIRGMPNEQRPLPGERHHFRNAARFRLKAAAVADHGLQSLQMGIQKMVSAARLVDFRKERVQRPGILIERAQHIEADHIARSLPDAVDRRLAVKPRQDALLDIAGAAVTLHRLIDEVGGTLADPVFADRRADAGERRLRRILLRRADGAAKAEKERRRRLRFQRKIGQNILHQRLLDQFLLEGRAMRGMMQRLRQRLTHQRGRANGAIVAGALHHLDDGAHAPPLLAEH